jgi:hypothetical protein
MACIVCKNGTEMDTEGLLKEVSGVSGAADATIKEVCKALHAYRDRLLPHKYLGSDLSILLR